MHAHCLHTCSAVFSVPALDNMPNNMLGTGSKEVLQKCTMKICCRSRGAVLHVYADTFLLPTYGRGGGAWMHMHSAQWSLSGHRGAAYSVILCRVKHMFVRTYSFWSAAWIRKNIFVLVRSVEEVNELQLNLPLPERFQKAINLGGMSITVTSVTNAAAFMFGSLTTIPAIRWCASADQGFTCHPEISGKHTHAEK